MHNIKELTISSPPLDFSEAELLSHVFPHGQLDKWVYFIFKYLCISNV